MCYAVFCTFNFLSVLFLDIFDIVSTGLGNSLLYYCLYVILVLEMYKNKHM